MRKRHSEIGKWELVSYFLTEGHFFRSRVNWSIY
jgi:hypothetical protein